MFRLLLILGIIVYLIYKIGSLFFRAGAASQQIRDQQRRHFNGPIDETPKTKRSTGPTNGKGKTGEYIDFEEVK